MILRRSTGVLLTLSAIILLLPVYSVFAKFSTETDAYGEYLRFPNRKKSHTTTYVNPMMFGAQGDGIADDTFPIQYAINYASRMGIKEVRIPQGTYNINISGKDKYGNPLYIDGEPHFFDLIGAGLILKSNVNIILDKGAILKAIPTDLPEYAVIYIGSQQNIKVSGGHIIGDYANHFGTKGQHGMCVWIQSSENVRIDNCDISQGWGDCIDVGCKWDNNIKPGSNRSRNIMVSNCILHDSRRQGISVVGCEKLFVQNCYIYNIKGDSPEAGIDLEVNYSDYPNIDCLFDGVCIEKCKGGAIIGYTTPTIGVSIKNSKIQSIELANANNISIVKTEADYMSFDNAENFPDNVITLKEVVTKNVTLYSKYPYKIIFNDCKVGNDNNMPALCFMHRNDEINSKESVEIYFDNCIIASVNNQNLFSISSTTYPAYLNIVRSKLNANRKTTIYAKEVNITKCDFVGNSLTVDFYATDIMLEKNRLLTEDCAKNINGYIFKFNTNGRVVYNGNKMIGDAKEQQCVIIPESYQPECIIMNNVHPQYKNIGNINVNDNKVIFRNNTFTE